MRPIAIPGEELERKDMLTLGDRYSGIQFLYLTASGRASLRNVTLPYQAIFLLPRWPTKDSNGPIRQPRKVRLLEAMMCLANHKCWVIGQVRPRVA